MNAQDSNPNTVKSLWRTIMAAAFLVLVVFSFMFLFCNQQKKADLEKQVAAGNLIGWWRLDDGHGTVAKDSSAKRHDGHLTNQPAWVAGRDGGALQFNGTRHPAYLENIMEWIRRWVLHSPSLVSKTQYVSLGNILPESYREISIACWIKHRSSGWQNIVERGVWDYPDGIGLLMDYFGKGVSFGHYDIGFVRSNANVQDDHWHHVAGTMSYTGSNYIYAIYVDGKLDNTITNAVGLAATTKGWAIGARYDGTWPYQGLIEDVRVYDRALTADEVQKLYAP